MENNSKDGTLKKNYIQKYQFLIIEYEQVKAKKHPQYTKVKDFYAAHRYLLLWATWWAQAIGDDRTTCLAALYNWSKDPLLRLQIYSTIVSYDGPAIDFLPVL